MVLIMKVIGSTCLLGTAFYCGNIINQCFDNRYVQLRHLYTILLQLKSEMQYMNDDLPDCFAKLGETAKEPVKSFLQKVAEDLNKQEQTSFSKIWKKNLEYLTVQSALSKSDIYLLEELSDKLGVSDGQSQMKAIDYVLLQIEQNRTVLEKEMKEKKKVVTTITMFIGFVILIILI